MSKIQHDGGICLIVDNVKIEGDLPFELIPGHVIRKASMEEVNYLRPFLLGFSSDFLKVTKLPYEYDLLIQEEGDSKSYTEIELQEKEWRYWVVRFEGFNDKIRELEYAAMIQPDELKFGIHSLQMLVDGERQLSGFGMNPSNYDRLLKSNEFRYSNAKKIEVDKLKGIGVAYEQLQTLDIGGEYVKSSLQRFMQMRALPSTSPLTLLGYFSIIESLIAHKPKNSDYDSITHQVSNKLILLSKLFGRDINLSKYFIQCSDLKIYKNLYNFRSHIAHGLSIDFTHKDFKILIGFENIRNYLHELTKELFLISLSKPEFMRDLKKC